MSWRLVRRLGGLAASKAAASLGSGPSSSAPGWGPPPRFFVVGVSALFAGVGAIAAYGLYDPLSEFKQAAKHKDIGKFRELHRALGSDIKRKEADVDLLETCANEGFEEALRDMVEDGLDVNAKNRFRRTAIGYAASKGHADVVRFLIGLGADVNVADKHGRTPVMYAARDGQVECLRLLLAHKDVQVGLFDEAGMDAIFLATLFSNTDCVRALLDHGADVNVVYPANETLLILATAYNDTKTLKALLEKNPTNGNQVAKSGRTAFTNAVYKGNVEAVKLLIAHGLDVNAGPVPHEKFGISNYTPLFVAASENHVEIVRALLEAGADPNILCQTLKPAIYNPIVFGHVEVVRLLLEHKASPDLKVAHGGGIKTVAELAAFFRNPEILALFRRQQA